MLDQFAAQGHDVSAERERTQEILSEQSGIILIDMD